MSSINDNQPEQNKKNLSNEEALKKLKELTDKKACFFSTISNTAGTQASRPMTVQQIDEAGQLWFLSANDSEVNKEIHANPVSNLYFQGSAHSDFLHLAGVASISENKAKIKELWEPIMKTWFTEGENDPRISVICVKPIDAYYWDTKNGHVIAGIKMLIGAMTGTTLDDSIEGKLHLHAK
jgi:general stress protein 26